VAATAEPLDPPDAAGGQRPVVRINRDRLWADLIALKEVGAYDDTATGLRAMSGAGHDAQEIAANCPIAMVFVAGEHGGISHTPREYSRPDACGNGIDVLANAILTLAEPVGP
jgi:acetylornithine deacetylase/succinyl-diaminopimelate desuccinylase-like protein